MTVNKLDLERCGQDLENLDSLIQTWYVEKGGLSFEELSELKSDIAYYLYELEKHRSDAFNDYNAMLFEKKKSMSVAAATIETDKELPLLYRLRHIMNGAEGVHWEIKETVSAIKKESSLIN